MSLKQVSKDIFSIGNNQGINATWGADQAIIDSYFDTRVSLRTAAFATTTTDLGTGLTTSAFSTGAEWDNTLLTFKGNAAQTETWKVSLSGIANPLSVTLARTKTAANAINTLGRAVFNLADQINATSTYKAEVRIGLLGEINLLVNRTDGSI